MMDEEIEVVHVSELSLENSKVDINNTNDHNNNNNSNNKSRNSVKTQNVIISEEDENTEVVQTTTHVGILRSIYKVGWNRREELGIIFGIVYILIGALIMYEIEKDYATVQLEKDWTYENSVYCSITSLASIGFGDIYPTSFYGKCYFLVFMSIGLVVIAFMVAGISSKVLTVISFARRQLQILSFFVHRKIKSCFDDSSEVKRSTNNRSIEMQTIPPSLNQPPKPKKPFLVRLAIAIPFSIIKFFLSPQSTFGIATTFLIGNLLFVSYLYMLVENHPYFDSLFFCFTVMTTIGYGDIVPETRTGKAIVCVFVLFQLGMITVLVGEVLNLMSYFVSKRIQDEKERVIIARLEDKVPWGASDILTHVRLRTIQLNLSPKDLNKMIQIVKEDLEEFSREYKHEHELARPLQNTIDQETALQQELSKRELHLSSISLNETV